MSQENVEIVRSVYEPYAERDFRAAAELLDRHVVLVLDPVFRLESFGERAQAIEALGLVE